VILQRLAPEVYHFFDDLKPELDASAWSGLLSLFQYNEMGAQFVRDFGFQCMNANLYNKWMNPSSVAKKHVKEKWEVIRAWQAWQAWQGW